jgi:multidrug transporter EmrE-like cation transporter
MTRPRTPLDERSEESPVGVGSDPAGLAGGVEGKAPRGIDAIGRISRRTRGILVAAAFMTLIGLALMVWSMAQPTPMPVILAMSVGQGLGILAFLLFGIVVLVDQLHKQREAGAHDAATPSVPEVAPELPMPAARSAAPSREASP